MSEKICPATNEPCLADCSGRYGCWIQRIGPLIRSNISFSLDQEANKYTKYDSIPEKNRRDLAEAIKSYVLRDLQK